MALVNYSSDSEASDNEQSQPQPKPSSKTAKPNFSVDKSNPQKIRVKLADATPTNGTHEDERAPKRAKLGGGFSGFNAMLPPPKRDADKPQPSKGPARKVFSLKTSSEAGFSRESDAELRQLFSEQDSMRDNDQGDGDVGLPEVPRKNQPAEQPTKGNTFMFKPLSVARGKKKKPTGGTVKPAAPPPSEPVMQQTEAALAQPKKKVSLFSAYTEEPDVPSTTDHEAPLTPEYDDESAVTSSYASLEASASQATDPQSLNTIAADLNLSTAERRQLFGRSKQHLSATNVVNFNTDAEYAANEALRATGEQVQHNPVRAIAPGKHSLRQLVSAAQGQKDALEESFATGKRNRKEAGSKYGW
ncbi:uncharacterized protein HMPREF1541_05925 [Cyphellophora europaea CBS 101466]|uniref:Mitotic checkpoint regulator, MAD2B-interacting-domain-containing protein n=1 Tax=Cyphellophora europaea (strain CBS 101466) TaxID=1220924 RepID=W2RVG6_CYPE1|nr:uncharacterized protein HMPREF1541_05925 [Cyphellophora europaea CBS 101466]ETN39699.1 hypothetical protein HMPREF1541_05925 [Cyphellophora europaea CBS 101466]